MKPHGTYKLSYRSRVAEAADGLDPFGREGRIVDSLRHQILTGPPDQSVRLRQVFWSPQEIFRLEIEEPEVGYQRTTLLERDTLEELLECEATRERIVIRALGEFGDEESNTEPNT